MWSIEKNLPLERPNTRKSISQKNEAHILTERKNVAFSGSPQCGPCVYLSLTGDPRILSSPPHPWDSLTQGENKSCGTGT